LFGATLYEMSEGSTYLKFLGREERCLQSPTVGSLIQSEVGLQSDRGDGSG